MIYRAARFLQRPISATRSLLMRRLRLLAFSRTVGPWMTLQSPWRHPALWLGRNDLDQFFKNFD